MFSQLMPAAVQEADGNTKSGYWVGPAFTAHLILGHLVGGQWTKNLVFTYIPNSRVPRMGKLFNEFISLFNSYGFNIVKLCIVLFSPVLE